MKNRVEVWSWKSQENLLGIFSLCKRTAAFGYRLYINTSGEFTSTKDQKLHTSCREILSPQYQVEKRRTQHALLYWHCKRTNKCPKRKNLFNIRKFSNTVDFSPTMWKGSVHLHDMES